MSIIAWDRDIVVADRAAQRGNMWRETKKLHHDFMNGGTPVVLGMLGTEETGLVLVDWFRSGADPDKWPECQKDEENWSHLLMFYPDKVLFYSQQPRPVEIRESFFCMGGAEEYAMGSMVSDQRDNRPIDVIKAVTIAIGLSGWPDFGVDIFNRATGATAHIKRGGPD